ncbi:MAG: polyphosphate kinase 1 [Bacteroidia bacterium]|nr:polyphosphate kinase 1 [Bacteroidia bacterium]
MSTPRKKIKQPDLLNREIAWLSFNDRVLQEADDSDVPLIERFKFLGIFSSNLDEFFRVRVATNKRLLNLKRKSVEAMSKVDIEKLLQQIHKVVIDQQKKFDDIYHKLLDDLKAKHIFFINEKQLNIAQTIEVKEYFYSQIEPVIFPLILDKSREFPFLRDNTIYLAVKMTNTKTKDIKYALIAVPTKVVSRFYVLPIHEENTYVMFVDDVIRISLNDIFSAFDYDKFEAYTIKLTRDAELELESDVSQNILEKVRNSLKQRKKGIPVRFIYDESMPADMLKFINGKLQIGKDGLIPGQRYHNFRDFIKFPLIGEPSLRSKPLEPVYIPELDSAKSLFEAISKRDYMLSHPYQPFNYVVRMLREAAIDPQVFAIKITLYRVAENSNIINSLINAVKNGKKVFVMMELKARFDEEHNIYWSNKLKEEGASVSFGIPNMKVHTKMCLIYRREGHAVTHYAHIGTGNYNGETAKSYCDHSIFTRNKKITSELVRVFNLIENYKSKHYNFKHLLVAPINMKTRFIEMINREIKNKKAGKPAFIILKMNSLVDPEIIEKLYDAGRQGVKIDLIVRGICCLVPGEAGLSENIRAISIVDKFLEHARVYIFGNAGNEEMFLGSADLMTRNLENRIEICFPVLDPRVKTELRMMINIQLKDNMKARIINRDFDNDYVPESVPRIRSQVEFYDYLKTRYE